MSGRARLHAVWFPHRRLWAVLYDLRRVLEENPGSIHSVGLAALLVAHNCFDAYLNYAAETLFPNGPPKRTEDRYRGVIGRFNLVADELSLQVRRGERPFRTVRELKRWRDGIVHPKIERQEKVVSFADPKYLKDLETEFFAQVRLSFIDRAIHDVEALCDVVQVAATRRHPTKFLGPGAFQGILGARGGELLK